MHDFIIPITCSMRQSNTVIRKENNSRFIIHTFANRKSHNTKTIFNNSPQNVSERYYDTSNTVSASCNLPLCIYSKKLHDQHAVSWEIILREIIVTTKHYIGINKPLNYVLCGVRSFLIWRISHRSIKDHLNGYTKNYTPLGLACGWKKLLLPTR